MESKTDDAVKPESSASQYSLYNQHEPSRRNVNFEQNQFYGNNYNYKQNEKFTTGLENCYQKRQRNLTNMSQPLKKKHAFKNQIDYQNSYKNVEMNGYTENDNNIFGIQSDQETQYDPGSGDEMQYPVSNITDTSNYRNEYDTDQYLSTGDYTMKNSNYEDAEHLCAKLRESFDDAEYYYIQKNENRNFTRKNDRFHDKSNFGTNDHYGIMGSEGIFRDEYNYNIYDNNDHTGEQIRTNYHSKTNSIGSPEMPSNLHESMKKNSIYKEVLKKINETASDLKDAGIEENINQFHESIQNLNRIRRNQPNRSRATEVSPRRYQLPRNHTIGQSKQDRKACSELDYSANYGRQNLEQKFDVQSEPQIYSRIQRNGNSPE